MRYVLGQHVSEDRSFLKTVDARKSDVWTEDLTEAVQFNSVEEALAAYGQYAYVYGHASSTPDLGPWNITVYRLREKSVPEYVVENIS